MLPTTFRFIWPSGFKVEDCLGIDQSATIIACAGHVCQWINTKLAHSIKDLPWMLPTKFHIFWPSGFRGKAVLEIDHSETRIAYGGNVC